MLIAESYQQRIWICPDCNKENMIDDDCFVLGEAHNQECVNCKEISMVLD
jgi:hypothetical protein